MEASRPNGALEDGVFTAADAAYQPREASTDVPQVVALGASAGGLEALEQFFESVPPDSGLSFVVIQHLSPDFKSLMDELLARHTQLTIHRVEDGMKVEPNSIYLIPPRKEMIIAGGRLLLSDKEPSEGLSLPIDTFMRSLAQEVGDKAVAVVLSGTGSDGSRGVRAVHEAGGFVLVQDEQTANFDGMPRSAIETGAADQVLPPHRMAEVILQHVYWEQTTAAGDDNAPVSESGLSALLTALRSAHGIDFSYYKPSTVMRRIERRVQLSKFDELNDYVDNVLDDPDELNALYRDLLIGVTKFFRDAEAFHLLEEQVIPQLLSSVSADDELRIWVAGCATGEEAYSLAILIHEALSTRSRPLNVKIFATDVHRASLDLASAGIYSEEALSEVSGLRMQRYFLPNGSGYQVSAELRKMIVFASHNVVKDAPFTKLDLISCRNLLIYLQPEAQNKVLSLFHFALRTGGMLFLGPSESTGDLAEEFEPIDRHWKVYRKRRDVRLPGAMRLPPSHGLERLRAQANRPQPPARSGAEVHLLRAYDALMADYVPASLLVDQHHKLVHSFTGAGKFLQVPDGRPPDDILEYVHPELKLPLSGALQRAAKKKQPVVYGNVNCPAVDETQTLKLAVRPLMIHTTGEQFYLITFETQDARPAQVKTSDELDYDEATHDRIRELEEELRYTKENLQATVEEMEATNEELQATNEELVASNEELQSTNEELHSVNEELFTVNAEHQRKITELTELTDDMDHLMRSTEIGTIFLDRELRIRKFTPQISEAYQILPQDVGRPLEAFAHNIRHKTLPDDAHRVIETGKPYERAVRNRHGAWFLLRILPYRVKGQVDGAVLNLIDIDRLKRSEEMLRRMSKVFMDGADPIIIEDLDGTIVDLNAEAERAYGWTRDELIGQRFTILVPHDRADESRELRRRCRNRESLRNVETVRRTRSGHTYPVLLTLSLLSGEDGEPVGLATMAKDITARKQALDEAQREVRRRDEFLAMLSHELRNPLGAVASAARILDRGELPAEVATEAANVIRRQTKQMARLLDDLLDVSRVTQGKIDIRKEVVDLTAVLADSVQAVQGELDARGHHLEVDTPKEPLWIEGDPSRLFQVQENLLMNAAKYTPSGGRIRVSVASDDGQAVLRVKDNGRGIPTSLLDTVFDLFVQGDNPLDRSEGGMGVGLSLVRMLVELHGGRVTAHSAGENQGSEFTVTLPLTTKSPGNEPMEEPSLPAASGRVLVVEDNDDSRRMLEELLRLDGYDVSVAADGESGYQAIEQGRADVALVDIGLPRMTGYELARMVRRKLPGRSIRLVALTGYGRAEDHRQVLEAGFDEHLVKPVAPADLARALARRPK